MKESSSRDTSLYTRAEPVGVAALITPWNYSIAIPAWKLAPALAATARDRGVDFTADIYPYVSGNTVLLALLPP